MSTLTWHRGSLRPYTSLWLTLRKLAYLNSLRVSDFPLGSHRKYRTGSTGSISEGQGLSELARLIEEPLENFEFSDSRFMPICWQFLFTQENAFCETCLSMGYHTRLFSLKLLNKCPIHDEPLHVDCACMTKHGERVDAISLRSPNTCHCGRLSYFDTSQLHRSQHHFVDTEKLKPIVRWLESLSRIYVASYMNSKCDDIYESDWLTRLQDLSKMHGFSYPSAFIKHQVSHYRWAYKTQSIEFRTNEKQPKRNSKVDYDFYWNISNFHPVDVFKAIARHMRKHVARRSEYWVRKFQKLATPEEIAGLIRSNYEAKLAFTELIWSTCLESTAKYRRWENRKSYYEGNYRYVCKLSEILARTRAKLTLDLKAVNLTNEWVSMHMFGVFCLALWKQAEKMVEDGIDRNRALWYTSRIDLTNLFLITASKVANENRTEFTFYVDEPLSLPVRSKSTKEERDLRYQDQLEKKRKRIRAAGSGLCLSWSKREGWHTAQSGILLSDWKPRKVLVHGKQSIDAVLYRSQGQYVLQLLDYKLQVLSTEFSDLFELMRSRFSDYCKLNQISLRDKKMKPEVEPLTPLISELRNEFNLHHKYRCIREISHLGFCDAAYMVYISTWALRNNKLKYIYNRD